MNTDELEVGTVVANRYRIDGWLGDGGMGIVYRATQLSLNKTVALKVLRRQFSMDPDGRARFRREAHVASTLRHPNAVEIFDFGEHGDRPYLSMEFLQGETLRDLLDRHPHGLGLAETLEIGIQVADVLMAAHDLHLVHRDLKPENIFLDERDASGVNRVRVVDFGLAFIAEGAGEGVGRLTVEGFAGGTPDYIAPEQARAQPVGPPADIYEFGCVLFEMITGRVPFEGSIVELLAAHCFQPPPTIESLRPGRPVPAVLEELVARMLAKQPTNRPLARGVKTRLDLLRTPNADLREATAAIRFVSDREGRMVPMRDPPGQPNGEVEPHQERLVIRVLGALDNRVVLALAANQIQATANPTECDAWFITAEVTMSADFADDASVPVVVEAPVRDFEQIAVLMRLGAAEVCCAPVRPADLARKIRRAVRKRRSRTKD